VPSNYVKLLIDWLIKNNFSPKSMSQFRHSSL
jgi:hypothetical protein